MTTLPRIAKSKAKPLVSEEEDELPSFLKSSSESEEEEEEWEPKSKVASKRRLQKKPESKPKKVAARRSTVVRKRTRKTAVKEELNVSLPISADEDSKDGLKLLHPKEDRDPKPKTRTKKPKMLQGTQINVVQGKTDNLDSDEIPSTSAPLMENEVKQEKYEEDFTFDEPPLKRIKLTTRPQGKPVKHPGSTKHQEELEMNWDIVQVLSERTNIEPWVCANIICLFRDENTIPFIARYRKELVNNLEADALREVRQTLEELRTVAKKTHVTIQKIKKEGKLSGSLLTALLNCKTLDELDHVSAPYKSGSKGTKAQRAKQLGLEPAAISLIENPVELSLFSYIKPNVKGLTTIQEVETGVQHILADMFAKDKDTLDFIRVLCQQRYICIQSALAKVSSKNVNEKDVNKFQLYQNFSCNIKNIQHHQSSSCVSLYSQKEKEYLWHLRDYFFLGSSLVMSSSVILLQH